MIYNLWRKLTEEKEDILVFHGEIPSFTASNVIFPLSMQECVLE